MIAVLIKCTIYEHCDHDYSPHKNTLFLRTSNMIIVHKMITVIFLRITIMITVLIKCTIYEDCDHDHTPHKNVMFLSLYRIMIMIALLKEDCDYDRSIPKNVLYLSLLHDSDHYRNPHKISYF